jgi:cyclopropane fatty-acyl-phospholipid synthase-like methyltransferase
MGVLRSFYYALSPSLRFLARRIYYAPIDLYEGVTRKRGSMIPPRGMIFIGSGDFEQQGVHLLDLLKKQAGLKPESRVLDVGCGIGRLAIPLTAYLNGQGSYDGFDIVKKGIDWCQAKISSRYANFRFKHIDLKNDLYNLKTADEAKDFVFPYEADTFDCIVLTSVFTHMMPSDVDNYLGQIARVMKRDGKCLATFFLLNAEIKRKIALNETKFDFKHTFEGYSLMDKKVKEANIAFEEQYLEMLLNKHGLEVEMCSYGAWSNNPDALDFQDVLVLTKKQL